MDQEERIKGMQRELLHQKGQLMAANILIRFLMKESKPELYNDLHKPEVRLRMRSQILRGALFSDQTDAKLEIGKGLDAFIEFLTTEFDY